jgi:pantoate--beta-alanine ligase
MKGKTIGFVPTMGALHEGHARLIRACRSECDIAVVSIFVNPTQFGPGEDYAAYPRARKNDAALCAKLGVDFLFFPSVRDMYPPGFSTYVTVEGLQDCLCGESRPGHFRGVATVVAKLLYIVMPDIAYFGRKDAQQSVLIKKMVQDLNMPVTIKVLSTVRAADGVALSSRNAYLNESQRSQARVLYASLRLAKSMIDRGERRPAAIVKAMRKLILLAPEARIDYIAVVDALTLEQVARLRGKCLIALAVRVGGTRLIDNIEVKI